MPLCSFVTFVVHPFSGGGLPSYAALCRSRQINRRGKIASLFETNSYYPTEEHYETAIFSHPDLANFQRRLRAAELAVAGQ
jgi:hypothetical protein